MASLKRVDGRKVSGEGVARSVAQAVLSSCVKTHVGLAPWSRCSLRAL